MLLPQLPVSVGEAVVVAGLAAWLLLTVVMATPLRGLALLQRDVPTRLVPRWTFFAPMPGMHEFRLLYRDRLHGGEFGPWIEDDSLSRARRLSSCLWNPDKRAKKALFDVASTLASERPASEEENAKIKLSVPYLLILTYVSALPRSGLSEATQFALARTSALEPEPEVMFVSGVHRIE